jgi:hypothetical protein
VRNVFPRTSGPAFAFMLLLLTTAAHAQIPANCARTFYVDYASGSNANTGTSKSLPWKVHPYMPGWSGSYSHSAGDCFIFKGGVTWPAATLPVTVAGNGTSTAPDYYGVDQAWYSGASWVRPVFDAGGSVVNGFVLTSRSYVTLDNLEITDVYASSDVNFALAYVYNASNIVIKNCFLHGWHHGGSTDNSKHGAVWGYGTGTLTVTNCELSNAEYPGTQGGISDTAGTFTHNLIHDMPTAFIGVGGEIGWNTIYNIDYPVADYDPAEHTNVLYGITSGTSSMYIHHNVIYSTGTQIGAMVYPEPCWNGADGTVYIYNNLYKGAGSYGCGANFCPSTEGGSGQCGRVYVWNNTGESTAAYIVRTINQGGTFRNVELRNNHYVTDISPTQFDAGSYATLVNDSTNVATTHAQATAQGYTDANNYAPTSGSTATKGKGAVLSCPSCPDFNLDILGNLRPPSGTWDAGAYQYSGSGGGQPPTPPKGLAAVVH